MAKLCGISALPAGGATLLYETLKSSIPIPSSEPETFKSSHLIQIVAPFGMFIERELDKLAECCILPLPVAWPGFA
jgi:hypothetical protein